VRSLNYHHLRLFWAVAREGNLTRASQELHLAPQTVSAQIRALEESLGEKLFTREGRRLVLTDIGRITLRYADEVFSIGQELLETLRGQPSERSLRLVVGVASVLPKLIVHRLIEPTLDLDRPVRVLCREGTPEQLLADLAIHRVDVVLSDAPLPPRVKVKAFNHHLGTCGVTFMAEPGLARRLRQGFPKSLDGTPVLLPTEDAVVRSELNRWFREQDVRPTVAAEFEDSALLKIFGQQGVGFFAIPSVIEEEVAKQYDVEVIGRSAGIQEDYYAISMERRVRHAGVVAICEMARSALFSAGGVPGAPR